MAAAARSAFRRCSASGARTVCNCIGAAVQAVHRPNFVPKLREVAGAYVDPPAHAIVLSVDEKSHIQALGRTQPGLPLKRGRAGTMIPDYRATEPPRCSQPSMCSMAR